ncbi:MAG: 16S rRNA (cytosine(967)-C(5))-methyltransferase RsmB [Pyrinomonadaceae bacterium]
MATAKTVSPARLAAFQVLREIEGGAFSSVALAEKEPNLLPLDRGLCHELVMGVLRWQLYLDALIEHHARRPIQKIDLPVRLALRLGLYQLNFLSRIPPSAAVNEAVNTVGNARLSSARTFVNAVLRNALREPDYDPAQGLQDPFERVAVRTSHPLWLIKRWSGEFGIEHAASFAAANNETPPISFRIVKSATCGSDVLMRLREDGATVEPSRMVTGAWRILRSTGLLRELVAEGKIYLQDEASQLVAHILQARSGERILDLCAAPGGKTTLLADLSDDRSAVIAGDLSARRLATINLAAATQGLRGISLVQLNALCSLPFAEGKFDRVLVDAACSGTGTLRRNPEIRWRITNDDIKTLSGKQLQFLLNAASSVKPGGRLVYSTCSVEIEENESVVDQFLKVAPAFQPAAIEADSVLLTSTGVARTWPQRDGTDGFFVAAFQRTY